MCKAHVLRFCCGHGVLMGLEPCDLGPCPMIKTTGAKLPQQPYRCYKCQYRLSSSSTRPTSARATSCTSSIGSMESTVSVSSAGSPTSSLAKADAQVMAPLPGVVRQPSGSVRYSRNFDRPSSSGRSFSFSCSSSSHFSTPHYSGLPNFLPHQDHPCPPCQIEDLRTKADKEVTAQAIAEFPHLTREMLVRNGRVREDWASKLTLEKYVDEKRQEEREVWLHVTRKWMQDLKKARVLIAEEDGLGLFG